MTGVQTCALPIYGTDPMYGIGVEWRPTERIGVRLEYEVFTEVLDEDAAATSVGFVYKMR